MFNGIHHVPANNLNALSEHIKFATGGKIGAYIAESLMGYGGVFPMQDG